jgi:SAM-dependent methyltransferase
MHAAMPVAFEWDERYGKPGYRYGTEPNGFLRSVVDRLPRGRVLSLGEGEGRNAVFLAEHGCDVLGIDASSVGLAKARALAEEREVTIRTAVADVRTYPIEPASWDGIVSIFCHLHADDRPALHRRIVAGLKPGGVLVLEAYTPRQLEYRTGGPPVLELLVALDELRRDLDGLSLDIAREIERDVREGGLHVGRGAVVQVLARKPGRVEAGP